MTPNIQNVQKETRPTHNAHIIVTHSFYPFVSAVIKQKNGIYNTRKNIHCQKLNQESKL